MGSGTMLFSCRRKLLCFRDELYANATRRGRARSRDIAKGNQPRRTLNQADTQYLHNECNIEMTMKTPQDTDFNEQCKPEIAPHNSFSCCRKNIPGGQKDGTNPPSPQGPPQCRLDWGIPIVFFSGTEIQFPIFVRLIRY